MELDSASKVSLGIFTFVAAVVVPAVVALNGDDLLMVSAFVFIGSNNTKTTKSSSFSSQTTRQIGRRVEEDI